LLNFYRIVLLNLGEGKRREIEIMMLSAEGLRDGYRGRVARSPGLLYTCQACR
jgi:hypothetical protein